MKLFHVSQEPNIDIFLPRLPTRKDMDCSKPLVWALTEDCLPNFLTPRDCPRVAYYATEQTTPEDIKIFFSSSARHCVAIEHDWYQVLTKTTLYLYEFDPSNFRLQDACAGYYVSQCTERPISKIKMDNVLTELFRRNVEVRFLKELWTLGDAVMESTLNWSLCRMRNAKPGS